MSDAARPICSATWEANHQLNVLKFHGQAFVDEFGIFGCDIIDHVLDALEQARSDRERAMIALYDLVQTVDLVAGVDEAGSDAQLSINHARQLIKSMTKKI